MKLCYPDLLASVRRLHQTVVPVRHQPLITLVWRLRWRDSTITRAFAPLIKWHNCEHVLVVGREVTEYRWLVTVVSMVTVIAWRRWWVGVFVAPNSTHRWRPILWARLFILVALLSSRLWPKIAALYIIVFVPIRSVFQVFFERVFIVSFNVSWTVEIYRATCMASLMSRLTESACLILARDYAVV